MKVRLDESSVYHNSDPTFLWVHESNKGNSESTKGDDQGQEVDCLNMLGALFGF